MVGGWWCVVGDVGRRGRRSCSCGSVGCCNGGFRDGHGNGRGRARGGVRGRIRGMCIVRSLAAVAVVAMVVVVPAVVVLGGVVVVVMCWSRRLCCWCDVLRYRYNDMGLCGIG